MSLEHLATLAPAQQLKIDEFISKGIFSAPGLPDLSHWSEFRDSLWPKDSPIAKAQGPAEGDGKPLPDGEPLPNTEVHAKVLPNPEALPKATPTARPIVEIPKTIVDIWGLESTQILVRSEYEEVEQVALSTNAAGIGAFIVTGHPGIGASPLTPSSIELDLYSGKSVFLILLLIRRLVLGLPTALQVEGGYAILFHEHGTSQFRHLDNAAIHMKLTTPSSPDKIWALVDSNQVLAEPAPTFRMGNPFFVVFAASPREERLGWTKKVNSRYFCMKPWTLSEVLQSYVNPPSGVHDTQFPSVARS